MSYKEMITVFVRVIRIALKHGRDKVKSSELLNVAVNR